MPLKLLCDENIPRAVGEALEEWGFDVAYTEAGTPDSKIAFKARREKRILLTFDSDFSNILVYPPQQYPGILRLKIAPPFIAMVVPALKRVFGQLKIQKDFRGRLIIVEATTFRVWDKKMRP